MHTTIVVFIVYLFLVLFLCSFIIQKWCIYFCCGSMGKLWVVKYFIIERPSNTWLFDISFSWKFFTIKGYSRITYDSKFHACLVLNYKYRIVKRETSHLRKWNGKLNIQTFWSTFNLSTFHCTVHSSYSNKVYCFQSIEMREN